MAITTRNLIEILIRAQDQASGDLKRVGDNAEALDKRLVSAAASMAKAGAAVVAAVSAAALAGGRYADMLDDLAARTLVSRETLAALGLQLTKGGGQFEDAEVAVRSFSGAVVDAVAGNKTAVAQFERLGISVDDLVGPGGTLRGFEELLPLVAQGFVGLRDEATKVDTAVALFGRSATGLVPIFSRGADGLAQMRQEARQTSLILGADMQDSAARLGDRMDDLTISTKGLFNALAGALDPTLGRTVSALADAAKAAAQFTAQHPEMVSGILSVVTALTALAAAPAIIIRVAAAMRALNLALAGLGAALGTAAGVLAIAFAAKSAADAFSDAAQSVKDAKQAEREYQAVLTDSRSKIEDVEAAQKRLNDARKKEVAPREVLALGLKAPGTGLGPLLSKLVAPKVKVQLDGPSVDLAAKQASAQMDAALQADPTWIPVGLDPEATRKAIELAHNVRDIEAALVSLDAQAGRITLDTAFSRQSEAVRQALRTLSAARERYANATAGTDEYEQSIHALKAAIEEYNAASGRVAATKDGWAQVTQSMESARLALVSVDLAAGRITMDEALARTRTAAEAAAAALETARATLANATPGTRAYATAVDGVSDALQREERARGALETIYETSRSRQTQEIETARAMREAVEQLRQAEEDLALTRSAASGEDAQKAISQRNLARLEQEANEARARIGAASALQAAGVPSTLSADEVQRAATAIRAYQDASLQARQAQDQLTESASVGGSVLSSLGNTALSIFSAIGNGALDMAEMMKKAILSMISDLIRMVVQLKIVKAIAGAAAGGPLGGFISPLGFLGSISPSGGGANFLVGAQAVDSFGARLSASRSAVGPGQGGSSPPVVLQQNTTINNGVSMGTEIENQRMGREINKRTYEFARAFVASPGFAR